MTLADKLNTLYINYRQLMFYVAYSVLHNISLSEECIKLTIERILPHIEKIQEIDSPQTKNLLVIIVKNIAVNSYNSQRKQNMIVFDEVEGWITTVPSDQIKISGNSQQLEDFMECLPESYRDALMLRYDNGYHSVEIASLLQISEENAKKRLQNARAKLADLIAGGEVN